MIYVDGRPFSFADWRLVIRVTPMTIQLRRKVAGEQSDIIISLLVLVKMGYPKVELGCSPDSSEWCKRREFGGFAVVNLSARL